MSWGRTLSVNIAVPETPVIFDDEDEFELKMRYAAAVFALRPEEWPQAGFSVFEGRENYGRAMQAKGWINDEEVQIELARLRRQAKTAEAVPTEDQLKAHLWQRAQDEIDGKVAVQYAKLLAETMGLTSKGNSLHVGDNVLVQNVLRVPEKSRDPESFAARFKESQTKLVADARSSRPAS